MPNGDFWILFLPASKKSLTVAAVQLGFRKTGIFPVSRKAIKDSDFGPSGATDNEVNLQEQRRQGENAPGKTSIPKQFIVMLHSCFQILQLSFPVYFLADHFAEQFE